MNRCKRCDSPNLEKRGTRFTKTKNVEYQKCRCKDCNWRGEFAIPSVGIIENTTPYINKYVITSHQIDSEINFAFYNALKLYCEKNKARLMVLTKKFDEKTLNLSQSLQILDEDGVIVTDSINITEHLNVHANLNISKTVENPLTGLDGLSKGKSLIIGHPVLTMKTLPVFGDQHPIMLSTTGTISKPEYNTSVKSGAKADHNHSYSALLVEVDNNIFHVRVLNSGEEGSFYDLDRFYTENDDEYSPNIEAIILGDTHVTVQDNAVHHATFGVGGIVQTLKPKIIVHHDLLDFGILQSHHNAKSVIKRYQKYVEGKDSVVAELNSTCKYLVDNTPDFVDEVVIVSSNHNDHLTKYLESVDIKSDLKNAKIYHYLFYRILDSIEAGREVNPFKFYFEEFCRNEELLKRIVFLGREDLYFVKDVLLSSHGDLGVSGSRFSPSQGRRYPHKMVCGHSHSPYIINGLWGTGTMTPKLDYQYGTPTGNMNTHCIIYPNGRRQLISIIKGKWRT